MANKEDEYKKLRSYLNKVVRGKNTDAILRSVSSGPTHLINNVEAVNDSLYIVSAKDQYLDSRLGDKGVIRPAEVGLSDEVFREIGIEITNRKQVRDLVHQLLRILYGEIFTRATSASQEVEHFNLEEGDNLIISFDGRDSVEISFTESQFSNINSATAQEVADGESSQPNVKERATADPDEYDERTLLDTFGEAAKQFLTQRVIPETTAECRWDWRFVRCEPFCDCDFTPKLGDYHLGRACRRQEKPDCNASTTRPSANTVR